MSESIKHARQLAALQAPAEVQWLALLTQSSTPDPVLAKAANTVLGISRAASRHGQPLALLPEIETLLRLDQGLPAALQIPPIPGLGPPAAAAGETPTGTSPSATVRRTLEAMTPWLQSPEAFASAALRADDRCHWGRAAPQITLQCCKPDLPANGALWRGRLRKRTDLLKPFDGMATEETIEITAEGHNGPQGQGWRRYSHFLVDCFAGPKLLHLVDDSGLIELSGNAHGSMLRIRKRVTVLLPLDLNDQFGAAIALGFTTLLWQWAMGFLNLGELDGPVPLPGHLPPHNKPAVPAEEKDIPRPSDPDDPVHVAVLGAGPAGLACAWLLSNPSCNGDPAWQPPHNRALRLKLTLVDKACRPGGKAASGRRVGHDGFGIEEHGLHVLMGCYSNLLAVLAAQGATGALRNLFVTQVPAHGHSANGPADTLPIPLQAWARPGSPTPTLAAWLYERAGFLKLVDWHALGLPALQGFHWLADVGLYERKIFDPLTQTVVQLAFAQPAPRPLLRTAVRLWQTVAALAPQDAAPGDRRLLQNLALQVSLKHLALAELVQGAEWQFMRQRARWDGQLRSRGGLADLARLLRVLARDALPANAASAEVRLAGELVELATTITAALDDAGLFPQWAINSPQAFPGSNSYPGWASALQAFDSSTLAQWLTAYGAPAGFAMRSGVLAAVTAGLFTTPDQIAAGTFIHGLVRLLLTYDDAPYKRLMGGTGEAVIAPIYQALLDKGVAVRLGTEVRGVQLGASGQVISASLHTVADAPVPGDFGLQLPGGTPGWPARPTCTAPTPPLDDELSAHAFVLAIPPFAGPITGLPAALLQDLRCINSVATIGLQSWAEQAPKFPLAMVVGLAGPLRCAAAMDHLQGDEGPAYTQAPVYWCGEVDDAVAARWQADNTERDHWLRQNAGQFVLGQITQMAHAPHLSVNRCGSARYVLSDLQTQKARRDVGHANAPNLWLAGDWTRSAFGCGSIEAAVTSGLQAAQQILSQLGCTVNFKIVGAIAAKDPA